jgi:hypothetical protein
MAKRTPPKPQTPVDAAPSEAKSEITTTTQTEAVTGAAAPEGSPTPPAQGNEGQADTAGEGQPSLATPEPALVPEDGVTLSAAVTAALDAKATRLAQPVPSFVITGPKKGRRRAGRIFGAEPVTIPAADLTEDEIAALTSDAGLKVTLIDAPY